MLELAEVASRVAPLGEVLSALCERIARLLGVEVCSIYLRERGEGLGSTDRRESGDLVLRATAGQSPVAVGTVRMRVGEGLTGFAVECLRPVSVAFALKDARNKAFAGVDETRFPALCALPLVDGGRAVGALVIQRRAPRAFGPREIVLAASAAPPVLLALDRAEQRRREASAPEPRAAARASRPHDVVLRGGPGASGRGLGTIAVRRRTAPASFPTSRRTVGDLADERARLGQALAEAAAEIAALEAWATERIGAPSSVGAAAMRALLSPSRYVLDDARLRGRMLKHVQAGMGAEEAVEGVMGEYARVLSASGDDVLGARALEVEALCLRVLDRLGQARPGVEPGTILAAARLTVCDAIELKARHGVGALLQMAPEASPGLTVAAALELPAVAGVGELFRWVADGDRVLFDGDAGTITINPSRVDIASFRRSR
jgi:phosphotransferase system enzyme I (PtsP)